MLPVLLVTAAVAPSVTSECEVTPPRCSLSLASPHGTSSHPITHLLHHYALLLSLLPARVAWTLT